MCPWAEIVNPGESEQYNLGPDANQVIEDYGDGASTVC